MGKVEKAPQTSSERAATGSNDLDARRVDGRAAPLLYVSPVQLNFEIPAGTAAGDVPLTVQTHSGILFTFSAG